MVSVSGASNTMLLSTSPDELFNRLALLLQEKKTGDNSNLFNEEINAILDKLLENRCMTVRQHKQMLNKCNLLHTNEKYVKILRYNFLYPCFFTS